MNPQPDQAISSTEVQAYDPPTVTPLGPADEAEATHIIAHFS